MGVAHHASFVPWLEMARTEALRESGRTYAQMEADGLFLVVTELNIRYRRPARYDDVLRISCHAEIAGRERLRHHYSVELVEAGDGRASRLADQPLATGSTDLACVDEDGRPIPMPKWVRDLIPQRANNEASAARRDAELECPPPTREARRPRSVVCCEGGCPSASRTS